MENKGRRLLKYLVNTIFKCNNLNAKFGRVWLFFVQFCFQTSNSIFWTSWATSLVSPGGFKSTSLWLDVQGRCFPYQNYNHKYSFEFVIAVVICIRIVAVSISIRTFCVKILQIFILATWQQHNVHTTKLLHRYSDSGGLWMHKRCNNNNNNNNNNNSNYRPNDNFCLNPKAL